MQTQSITAYTWQSFILLAVALFTFAPSALAQQSNTADLRGHVRDQQGAAIAGANVTARSIKTNAARSTTTDEEGNYQLLNLPPDSYEITTEAAGFRRAALPSVRLTVGQRADIDIPLEAGEVGEPVTVSTVPAIVEQARTAVTTTVDQQRIENLPVNPRDYLSIALTTSTATRDNLRPASSEPTSGLNISGQRGRSNLVQVDGADFIDSSTNAPRATVPQEAVREFQIITNSYPPEFGRATGGVINVVTKSGTNELRGSVFGFLRHHSFQARDPFSPIMDPPYTRAQYGASIGGPLAKDRTFFFFAFERRQRNELGFFTSDVTQGLTASVTVGAPFLPVAQTFRNITPAQAAYANSLLATGNISVIASAVQYLYFASSGGSTALTGFNPLRSSFGGLIPTGQIIGSRFYLSGEPVPVGTVNGQGQPIAFRPLLNLPRDFPVTERATFNSLRLNQFVTKDHLLSMRLGYSPGMITGIQSEAQTQVPGQNDFSRTGVQNQKDISFVTTLTSTISTSTANEARFSFGRHRASFRSQNQDAVAFNITGTAFIGREPFSPIARDETRYQFVDSLNLSAGNHTLRVGGDVNFVSINAKSELNFAGQYNFGGLSATTLGAFPTLPGGFIAPDFTPVQQYGLGFPSSYIQGFGNSASSIRNNPMALFAQDSWRVRPNLTINYGVRYDLGLTGQIAPVGFTDPLSGIQLSAADVQAAQDALNVRQGFPRDRNNFAPRLGLAWDITGDGRTVMRAAYGLFYARPPLAAAINSDIADAVQQPQLQLLPGSPDPRAFLNATQVFQGSVCAPGQPCPFGAAVCPPLQPCPFGFPTPGVAAGAVYQRGRQRFDDQTFPGLGPVLPFTLPVSKDFASAYATQANLSFERRLTANTALSVSYLFVGGHRLPHQLDVNAPRADLQIENFRRYANRRPFSTTEAQAALLFPTTAPGSTFINPTTGETFSVVVPGLIIQGPRGRVVQPAAANFFRPNAPNYFLAAALTGLSPAAFNAALAGTVRAPGAVSPFGAVNALMSDGNSNYNALNVDLRRRLAGNFQLLASYTWSHAIDDSSDFLSLPQDSRDLRAERADSLYDQRHRFVFSGVFQSPEAWRRPGAGWRRLFAEFTVAPIFEISSGRPFNILTKADSNGDLTGQTDRPSVGAGGTLVFPSPFSPGNLGRNKGITDAYASLDLRVSRTVRFGERVRLDLIAEGFNLFNRFNEAAASPFFTDVNAFNQRDGSGRYFSRPIEAFNARQFQFGLRLSF